jgi:cell division protein FtsB
VSQQSDFENKPNQSQFGGRELYDIKRQVEPPRFILHDGLDPSLFAAMPRRVKSKPSLFAPAGDFIRRLSNEKARFRRKVVIFGLLGVIAFFIYSVMNQTYGIPRITRLELERKALEQANRRQIAELIDAAIERKLLQTDNAYIEYIARTRYHMAYPNETIYRYHGR